MMHVGSWLRGAGFGATAMYFFDPDAGRRRRALVRDRAVHLGHVARDEIETELRDARNRLQGALATTRRVASADGADSDERIAQELRSRFARTGGLDAVVVQVRDGCVRVGGPVLARDAERVRRAVRRQRGARSFVDELEIHESPDVPALRSRSQPLGRIDPAGRMALGLVGAAAVLPLLRHVPILVIARLLALGAIGSSIFSVEQARRRAIASGPGPRDEGRRPEPAAAAPAER